jgi:hypothetical protein
LYGSAVLTLPALRQKQFARKKVIAVSELLYLLLFIVLIVAIRPSKTELCLMQSRLDSLYKEKAPAVSDYEGRPGGAG